jgi:hypothetical protein
MLGKAMISVLTLSAVISLPCAALAAQHTDSLAGSTVQLKTRPDSPSVKVRTDSLKGVATTDSGSIKLKNDSLKPAVSDTTKVKGKTDLTTAAPPEDTLYHFWNHPYWGIGAGWGLGSFPIFTEWKNGLPDSAFDLAGRNSQIPHFSVEEPTDAYYIVWPLLLSYTPFTGERRSLTVESSFYFLFSSKSCIVSLKNDSLPVQSATWSQSCAAYYFSIGLSYRHAIPEEYFKVEGVKKTSAILGLSVSPLVRITKSSSFSSVGLADSTRAALQTHLDNRSFNGVGVSWKIGLSTLNRLSQRSGLQIDLVYIGRYNGFFNRDLRWKDINPASDTPHRIVSFMSNTFEINMTLQSGKKKPDTP